MRLRTFYELESMSQFGIADCESRQQVIPLVHELAARDRDVIGALGTADLPRFKRVAATNRFCVNATKVIGDRAAGRGLSAKSMQLWMMPVAVGSASQYSLRQEGFTPQSNEPAGVKVLGMHGPKAHASTRHRPRTAEAWKAHRRASPPARRSIRELGHRSTTCR